MQEVVEKMERIRALSDAIERQKEECAKTPSYENTLTLQLIERDRRELQALLPPLHAVK